MKSYTQKELKAILERHKMWLNDTECGARANLAGAYLSGANLEGAYLQRANLRGAALKDACLQGAYLRGADLNGADLMGANMQDVYLRGADLRGADLQYADLRGAYLQRANLRGAYLPNGIYQVVGCGSSNRCTTYDSINDCVICGCWNDNNGNNLDSFKHRIEDVYGKDGKEPNTKYYAQYMAAIRFFEAMKKAEE